MITVGRTEKGSECKRLLFTGDSMLMSDFWNSKPHSESVSAAVSNAEFSMTNLEAPIGDGEPKLKWGPTISTGKPAINKLSLFGFDAVSLANNHMLDYGYESAIATEMACKESGMKTAGIGPNPTDAIDPLNIVVDNTSIAIFSIAQREFGMAEYDGCGAAWAGHPKVLPAISRESDQNDIVIVNAHGGLEHIPAPPPNWTHQLRAFAEAGADAIIGHHPHVAQGWETHNESVIFYSLGNWLTHQSHLGTHWTYFVELCIKERNVDHAEVNLVEQEDGSIQKMENRDQESHSRYLMRSGELSGNMAAWQTISAQLFNNEYSRRMSDWSNSMAGTLISEPLWALDRLTQQFSVKEDRLRKDMSIVNFLQNESHSEAIRTGLELRAGSIPDERTPEMSDEIGRLFEFISEGEEKSNSEVIIRRMKTVLQRIKE